MFKPSGPLDGRLDRKPSVRATARPYDRQSVHPKRPKILVQRSLEQWNMYLGLWIRGRDTSWTRGSLEVGNLRTLRPLDIWTLGHLDQWTVEHWNF